MPAIRGRRPAGRAGIVLRGVVLAGLLASHPASAAPPGDRIPWKGGLTFSRTSVDDDVRNVLRALLSANGLSVIFRPGVAGKVSLKFTDMPCESAFEQLVQEGGLESSYNPATATVTIGPSHGGGHSFIPLGNVDWPSLRQMLVNFGIGTEGVTYDPTVSMLGVSGDPARIAQVTDLMKALQDHYGASQTQALDDRQRAAAAQRSDLQRRSYEDALNVQTKVFRLRFADVSQTTRQFHGQSLTIPGVLGTLKTMLGLDADNGSVGPTPGPGYSSHAATPFRPTLPGIVAGAPAGGQSADAGPYGTPALARDPGDPALSGPGAIGRPSISADPRTNSIIVRGSPAAIAAVEDVLRQIDQPVRMVEIEVMIATTQVGVAEELGVAWRGGSLKGGAAVDTGTSGAQAVAGTSFDPVSLLPTPDNAGATVASFVTGGSHALVQAQIQALAQQNKARILSAPHLVTLDNVTARITRSQDIYVPVDTGGLNGQGLSEIQTGLTLQITPSIVPDAAGGRERLIRLSLDAQNSAPSSNTGTSQISVASQEVQTDVLVPDGGTFVVGGLFDDQRSKTRSGVPILKDIPVLGGLFRDDAKSTSLGETVFFITPRIVEQQMLGRDVARTAETIATVATRRQELTGAAREMDGTRPRSPSPRVVQEDE